MFFPVSVRLKVWDNTRSQSVPEEAKLMWKRYIVQVRAVDSDNVSVVCELHICVVLSLRGYMKLTWIILSPWTN